MFRKIVLSLMSLLLLSVASVHAQDGAPTFVLVHGAFQDASGWDATIALLEAEGYTAVAVNLPGRGDDTTPPGELSLTSYRDAIIEVIEAQEAPVILVGHSFGGINISNVAETIPDQIDTLVYLAAYLPLSGDSLTSIAPQDTFSVASQEGALVPSEDSTLLTIPVEGFAPGFCPDCTEEQAVTVTESYLDEPLPPLAEPVTLTAENFGSVRKVYIMTVQDIIVSPKIQALGIANNPVAHVFALNTGHVPYITQPEALAALLMDARVTGETSE